jgi:hypothetical protein
MGQFIKKPYLQTGSPPQDTWYRENVSKSGAQSCFMYRIVYGSRLAMLFTLCLIVAFLVQPVMKVSADTTDIPVVPVTDATLSEVTSAPGPEVVTSESAVTPTVEPATEPLLDEPASSETPPAVENTETSPSITPAPNLIPDPVVVPGEETESTVNDEVIDASPVADDELATTTEIVEEPEAAPLSLTVESDNVVQFDRASCVTMEGGAYYCQQDTSSDEQRPDGLYAFPDADGDLEIYLKQSSEFTQLTDNLVDDAAPYFDKVSNSMVWHRMINERYQIMTMDMESAEEVQLTDTNANNMEPTRAGDYIAWQYWTSGAWQIMLFDGTETLQLTTTADHNLAPSIRNGLVMWNRLAPGSEKTIEVYDIEAAEYTSITDDEGGVISNPRMVLVYETEFENGDVVTKGYDLKTGEIAALATTPAPLPEDIPEPDATGETRALIQAKPAGAKEDPDESVSAGTGSSTPPEGIADTGTLVISNASSTENTVVAATSTIVAVPAMTLDLRSEPAALTLPEIADVVVPSFEVSETHIVTE